MVIMNYDRNKTLVQILLWVLQLYSHFLLVTGKDIRKMVKRESYANTSPYYNLDITNQHQFTWRPRIDGVSSTESGTFDEHLRRTIGPSDFLYIFFGDTQHWVACAMNNFQCFRATDNCYMRPQESGVDCVRRQSEYANKVQQISMAALNRRLYNVTGRRALAGLVINGDLTEFGHRNELDRFEQLWTSVAFDNALKIYPGLGNHDYENNVGDCFMDQCANRMLRWYRSYVKDRLKLNLDLRTSTGYFAEENIGSLAYSWDECMAGHSESGSSTCFHFIQLNNYPTYAKHIGGWTYDWKILPSLNWLSNDIRSDGLQKSIIINFHRDIDFSESDQIRLREVLNNATANSPNSRVLAILFAHTHPNIGLKDWWCIGGRRVPLLYSGSVPGNQYTLAHFSPTSGTIQALYSIRVEGESFSAVKQEPVPAEQQPCVNQ